MTSINFILDHIWQSTLFVMVAWLLALLLRANAARVRHRIWIAASIKFLIPFAWLIALGEQFSVRRASNAATSSLLVDAMQTISDPLMLPPLSIDASEAHGFTMTYFLFGVWALGCAGLLARWFIIWLRVRAAVRIALPITPSASTPTAIPIKSSASVFEPAVVGILRPTLLVPKDITSRLTMLQWRAILAHELCHVRRHDNLTAAIHMLTEAIFWFHPLVWWIGARLVEERERACDEHVVNCGNDPQTYAEGILKVCQFYLESKLICVAGVSGADLKQRIEVIMKNQIASKLGMVKSLLIAAAGSLSVGGPIAVGMLTGSSAAAQGTANMATFEAVLITPTTPSPQATYWNVSQDGMTVYNMTLRKIIGEVYGLPSSRVVGGPDWLDTQRFNITATAQKNSDANAVKTTVEKEMLRQSLERRFNLLVHKEDRQLDAFVLLVGDSGAKLRAAADNALGDQPSGRITLAQNGVTTGSALDMDFLAYHLASRLGRPVLNQTNLAGKYDFALQGPLTIESAPTLLKDQLGLKLESHSEVMEVLAIDAAQLPIYEARELALQKATPLSEKATELALDNPPTSDQYHGERLNLRFADIPTRDVLSLLARTLGQTIAIDPRVTGNITLTFNKVPADQAMDTILRAKQLTKHREGDVWLIEPIA